MKKGLLYISFFISTLPLLAQEPPRPAIDIENFAERIFPLQEDDLPYEELYETLLLFYTQPLDLNRASREELQSLYLLNHRQIESLLQHINRNGPLLSLYELQAVPGWDLATIQQLLPFVRVQERGLHSDNRSLIEHMFTTGTRFALLRWERLAEPQAGFIPGADSLPPAFTGSPDKLYFRLRMSKARSFSIGLTAEKDAGEQLSFRPAEKQYGADFYSFHAMIWNRGPFKRIVVGDYQVQYGQGLVLGAGFYLGKGSETITTVARPSLGIRPYTSVVESGFFKGAGVTFGSHRKEISLFAGSTPRDASIRSSTDSLVTAEDRFFSAFQTTGLHRTRTELANRNTLRETNFGSAGRWQIAPGKFSIGYTSLYTRFSQPQQPLPQLYNRFAFRGRHNFTASVFTEAHWHQLGLFGEWAISKGGGWGGITGVIAPISQGLDVSLLYRHYTKDFYSFYGSGFAEGTRLQNESGLYWGLKYQHSKALWLTAYVDRFWFPWLRYRVSAPSDGYEYLLRLNWQPGKQLIFHVQFRNELKQRDISGPDKTRILAAGSKKNYLLNLDYRPDQALQFRSRVQWSSFQQQGIFSRGYALIQDASYGLGNWRISTRYALFHTDDWENRQYAFEKDVLWSFTVPAYYGRGIRYYAMLQWKAGPNLSFWFRWARSRYRDREVIGSGLERIEGSTRSNLKIQLKYDF
ncbi:helix-hairpin-helix domain-containing protein [Cesiribacter sp. SM1]|uniref:ComEA family DNA-binding protein n=1 Tax=Cesiribacter sp. SM1 TaxID=2861196 RepID=UPI001CD61E8B|nr:helix-hairpin-helix domain-containing protein [Cesiribacter sp. SM1]